MAFDENECLHVAKYIVGEECGPCSPEAAQRAAVSRAYFAAFICVRNHEIDHHGFRPKNNADDHKGLRYHLNKRGAGDIAGDLHDLSLKRGRCDYDKIILGTKSQRDQLVSDAINLSESIIKNLNK